MTIIAMYGEPSAWGFVLDFLDDGDPRSARAQFDERYRGGWRPMPGCQFDIDTYALRYPGDPPFQAISIVMWRDEVIILYPGSFVLVLEPGGSWEVSRMD